MISSSMAAAAILILSALGSTPAAAQLDDPPGDQMTLLAQDQNAPALPGPPAAQPVLRQVAARSNVPAAQHYQPSLPTLPAAAPAPH